MQSMPAFRSLMYAYAQAFLEQVQVSVACNGAHGLKERLARWLLMSQDRVSSNVLPYTQDLLAAMLGTDRPSVSVAVGELQAKGRGARFGPQHTWVADPNTTFSGTLDFTHVYIKRNGKWMLAALHNQVPPPPANAAK